MRRRLPILVILLLASATSGPRASSDPPSHCASRARVTAVPGEAGAFRIETSHGTTVAHALPTRPAAAHAVVEILLRQFTFDADNNSGTEIDTVIVPPGTTVRWRDVEGSHTLTNGYDSGDPKAGTKFDYFMTPGSQFDSTFTRPTWLDFFCFFHEPVMTGTLVVRQNLDVPSGSTVSRASFSRSPSPNPTRGIVGFAVVLPSEQQVALTIHDVTGRRIATVHEGLLSAGEHAMRWNGQDASGRAAASGRYLLRLQARGIVEARALTLLH